MQLELVRYYFSAPQKPNYFSPCSFDRPPLIKRFFILHSIFLMLKKYLPVKLCRGSEANNKQKQEIIFVVQNNNLICITFCYCYEWPFLFLALITGSFSLKQKLKKNPSVMVISILLHFLLIFKCLKVMLNLKRSLLRFFFYKSPSLGLNCFGCIPCRYLTEYYPDVFIWKSALLYSPAPPVQLLLTLLI